MTKEALIISLSKMSLEEIAEGILQGTFDTVESISNIPQTKQEKIKFMKHIFEDDYSEREKYTTCLHCGKPMADNQMVKDSYQLSTQFEWLKHQVKIVADMLQDKEYFQYSCKLYELIEKADRTLKF